MNWKIVCKIGVSLGLIIYLISKLDIRAICEAFGKMDIFLLSFSLPFIVVMYLIKARKWQALLNCIDIEISMRKSLEIVLMGTFYGAITPGRAGEVSRAFYLSSDSSRSIPTIIMDRIIDIICLLLLSTLSLAFVFKDRNLIYLTALAMAPFIAGIILITNEKFVSFIFKKISKSIEYKENYIRTIREITENKKVLIFVFLMTIGYYLANIVVYWVIIKSLSLALNNILVFSLPIIIVLGNFPISISGFGVREFVS